MPTKTLLCLTLGASAASASSAASTATRQLDAMLPGWELCKAASVRDAARQLRGRPLSVGLLLLEFEPDAADAPRVRHSRVLVGI